MCVSVCPFHLLLIFVITAISFYRIPQSQQASYNFQLTLLITFSVLNSFIRTARFSPSFLLSLSLSLTHTHLLKLPFASYHLPVGSCCNSPNRRDTRFAINWIVFTFELFQQQPCVQNSLSLSLTNINLPVKSFQGLNCLFYPLAHPNRGCSFILLLTAFFIQFTISVSRIKGQFNPSSPLGWDKILRAI